MENMPRRRRLRLDALISGLGQEPGATDAKVPALDSYERGPVRGRAAPIEEHKKLGDQQLSYEHLLEQLSTITQCFWHCLRSLASLYAQKSRLTVLSACSSY
jgi:hypothetical protein